MKYNICFTLGDPSGDGHANTSEYHIVATHSVEEITSNGERQLQSLSKWIHENKADWNEKCLLVFDEVDKGFDLRYQVGLHNMLTNLPVMHGVKILAVSHTLIPMLLEDKVYAFKYRIMLSPSTYVALETGYSIKINDYNEREEV